MIIGMVGRARSGKDTFAQLLKEAFKDLTGDEYIFMAYAGILKEQVGESFGLTKEQLYGDQKELPDGRYLRPTLPYCAGSSGEPNGDGKLPNPHWTAREIMQAYGEFHRSIDVNYWVKKVVDKIEKECYSNVIITDIRYPNELSAINTFSGVSINIVREDAPEIHGSKHSSETSMDSVTDYDFVVNNNGTIEDLKEVAYSLAHRLVSVQRVSKNKKLEEVENG